MTENETGELDSLLSDVSGVIRSAYIISHIDKFLKICNDADQMRASLPKGMRETLGSAVMVDSMNQLTMARMAYFLSQFPAGLTGELAQMFTEIRQYVGVFVDEYDDDGNVIEDAEPRLFGMLEDTDMKVIEEMVTFVQKVGSRSTRHLLNFLQSVNEGEAAWLLIKGKGRDSECSMRQRCSPEASASFDID